MSRRDAVWSNINDINANATNRWDTFQDPFGYNQMENNINQLFGQEQAGISRQVGTGLNDARQSNAARLASQGITGGSIQKNAIQGSENQVLGQGFNALQGLGIGRLNTEQGLMNTANQNAQYITGQAQNVDQSNIQNNLSKQNLASNYLNDWEQSDLQRQAQPGVLSDIFSGLGAGAQLLGLPTGFNKGSGGANSNVLTSLLGLLPK
jgi:hypothetical protein